MHAKVADWANVAFSCALSLSDPRVAIELLEQGRGILWNQLARFNISLAGLEGVSMEGNRLVQEFKQLSAQLHKHAHVDQDANVDPYWQVSDMWKKVVDTIRQQEGYSRFLLPPHFDDLREAALGGPVIIVNASKDSCDAVIVLHTQSPIHVRLDTSLKDVIHLCSQFSDLIHNHDAYGDNREAYIKKYLRELWDTVVEPIVAVLQNEHKLPLGSRIWWCPAAQFTMLPFHAAGPYRKTEKNLSRLYISSYAPSLLALIRARERARAQKQVRETVTGTDKLSFVTIGQGEPNSELGLSELPEIDRELCRIREETDMPSTVDFESMTGDDATIEGTIQAFRDHRWVHLACHGGQHKTKPFQSWFAMKDGRLTLLRIIRERYTNSEFAFLSACHTAAGDKSTPDEVLHLAAGMQFAGFNGVIGTLWKVDDSVAPEVATRFYREMFKHPELNYEHAAAALNTAVIELEGIVPLEARIVFVHIGI